MMVTISWVGHNPIDFTEPQHAAALLRQLFTAMEHIEPLAELRFEVAGILCIGEYNMAVEPEVEPPEEYVCLWLGFVVAGRPFISEDGRPGVLLCEDDINDIVLDSNKIPWRA
jgi:hypothetical protein